MRTHRARPVEWGTFSMIVMTYALWALSVSWLTGQNLALAMLATTVLIALHASLTHEVLHGHPFDHRRLNEALMFPCLNLTIPYERFRDMHLAHHRDARLTDPYDDPESNYLAPEVWGRMPKWMQAVFRANNTLLGRMAIGPALGTGLFVLSEWRAARAGDRAVIRAWALHAAGAALVVAVLAAIGQMPVWAYLASAYGGLSLLKIRTFLEHQAHEKVRGRTAIIEDRGPLAFLFLNNNLHVVHHMHPAVPWYRLPQLYRANAERYRRCNEHYVYRSYGEVFRRHFLRAKDPVPHPLWRAEQ